MANAQVPNVPLTRPQRKSYFPFKFGMRSQGDQGKGALSAINSRCNKDGHVEKTLGAELIKEILGITQITAMYEYSKSDGTVQTIVIYKIEVDAPDPDFYVMRLIEEDLTVGSPLGPEAALTGTISFTNGSTAVSASGGAFLSEIAVGDWIYETGEAANAAQVASITDDDNLVLEENYAGAAVSTAGKIASVHFAGTQFDFCKLGGTVFVSNDFATTPMYQFNGVTLAKTANVTEAVYSIATDANRVAAVFQDRTDFSGDGIASSNDFTAGTGINRYGTYGSSIAHPRAVCEGGDGIVIFGEVGSEGHQVYPNSASDDVSSKTKNPGYKDGGEGVSGPRQCVSGAYFVYIANEEAVTELNPYTGQRKPLTDVGAVRDLWKDVKKGSVTIGYDPGKNYIAAAVQRYGQNDTLVCFDIDQKERPAWYSEGQYNGCLATVGGSLHGGSSRDGKVHKLFTGSTDISGSTLRFKYRIERDGTGGVPFLKTFRKFVVYAALHPRSKYTARVFLNDDTTPVFEKTVTTTSAVGSGGGIAEYGMYVFRLGSVLQAKINNSIRLNQKNARFNRISFEFEEISAYGFKLKDVIMEFKSRNRFVRKFLSSDVS